MPRISQKLKETAKEARQELRTAGGQFKEMFGIGNLRGAQACAASPQVCRKGSPSQFSDIGDEQGDQTASSVKLPQVTRSAMVAMLAKAEPEIQRPCKHLQYQTTVDDKMVPLYELICATPKHPNVKTEVILARWFWMERISDRLKDADDATFAQLKSDLNECTDTYEAFQVLARFYHRHFVMTDATGTVVGLQTPTVEDKKELMRFLAARLKSIWTARTLAQIPYPITDAVSSAMTSALTFPSPSPSKSPWPPIGQVSKQIAANIKRAKALESDNLSEAQLNHTGRMIASALNDISDEFRSLLWLNPNVEKFLNEPSDRFQNVMAVAVGMDDPLQAYNYVQGEIDQVMPAIPSAPPKQATEPPLWGNVDRPEWTHQEYETHLYRIIEKIAQQRRREKGYSNSELLALFPKDATRQQMFLYCTGLTQYTSIYSIRTLVIESYATDLEDNSNRWKILRELSRAASESGDWEKADAQLQLIDPKLPTEELRIVVDGLINPKVPTPPKEEAPAVAHPRHHRVKKKVAATLPELKPVDLRGTRFKLLPPIGSAQVEQTKQGEKDAH